LEVSAILEAIVLEAWAVTTLGVWGERILAILETPILVTWASQNLGADSLVVGAWEALGALGALGASVAVAWAG